MRIIETVSAQRFSLDGIEYFKNYISEVAGNQITIFNAYDRKDVRVDWEHFGNVEVNGVVYGNSADLQSALLPVIYTRNSLAPSGSGVQTVNEEAPDILGNVTVDGTNIDVTDPTTSTDATLNDALQNIFDNSSGATPDLQAVTDVGNTITDGTDTNNVSANGIVVTDFTNTLELTKNTLELREDLTLNVTQISSGGVVVSDGTNSSYLGLDKIQVNGTDYPLPTGASSPLATLSDITGGVSDGDKGDITVSSGGTVWTIDNGAVTDGKIASGIDATKIADGSVSNTEFQRLDGVTSNIQTQLDNRVGFLFKNTTQTVVTGTTGEVIIYAEEVLANTISNNTILSFKNRNYRSPRAGTCVYKLYINTVDNLSGSPVQIGRFDASTNHGSNPFEREYLIKDNTLNGFQFNTAGFTDLVAGNVNQGTTTYNINTTYYWIFTAQPNTSSDSLTHSFSILERI